MKKPAGICVALTALFLCASAGAQSANTPSASELYTLCTFFPDPTQCEPIYQKAATDDNPAAASALTTYKTYARYLKTDVRALTDADKAYLTANKVTLPDTLIAVELGGLHGVINDPAVQSDATLKLRAVNNFLARATQAHIYCVLHDCKTPLTSSGPLPPAAGN